jgi:3-hydroxyacyl-CoA dehydrogenase/enoyl-CoA hydratase/3-hydroxybutyryl-CoA epimerase
MLEGNDLRADQGPGSGLVGELAATATTAGPARAWIAAHPSPAALGRSRSSATPAATRARPAVVQMLAIAPSMAATKGFGNYPALTHILSGVFEGGLLDIDRALEIESATSPPAW